MQTRECIEDLLLRFLPRCDDYPPTRERWFSWQQSKDESPHLMSFSNAYFTVVRGVVRVQTAHIPSKPWILKILLRIIGCALTVDDASVQSVVARAPVELVLTGATE